jgi:hypothetical protein
MEIRTGKYTSFILTVIAVLLAGLLFQTSVGLVTQAHAQSRLDNISDEERDAYALRRDDTADNIQQARTQSMVNASSDPAVAAGLQSIASAVGEVAQALRDVARSNDRIAQAVSGLELSPTINNTTTTRENR